MDIRDYREVEIFKKGFKLTYSTKDDKVTISHDNFSYFFLKRDEIDALRFVLEEFKSYLHGTKQ